MRKTAWLFLIAGLAIHSGLPAGARSPARPLPVKQSVSELENGSRWLKEGRWEDAEAAFSRWIALHPQDPLGYVGRGDTLARSVNDAEKLQRALADFDRALQLAPDQPALFFLKRGQVLSNLDRDREAVGDFNRALAQTPDDPLALSMRARNLWALGDLLPALADLDRAIELSPQLPLARGLRGLARVQIGQLEDGIEDLELAVALDPQSPFRSDLSDARERLKNSPIGPWEKFVSPDGSFELTLPTPIRVRLLEREMTVASAVGRGHIFGVVRHANEVPAQAIDLSSEECRQALFHYLEKDGGKVDQWKIVKFCDLPALHVAVSGTDRTLTDVIVVVSENFTYLVAAVRRQDSRPFSQPELDRFRQSFRIFR